MVSLIRTPIFSGSKQSGSWSRAAAALLIREQYVNMPIDAHAHAHADTERRPPETPFGLSIVYRYVI